MSFSITYRHLNILYVPGSTKLPKLENNNVCYSNYSMSKLFGAKYTNLFLEYFVCNILNGHGIAFNTNFLSKIEACNQVITV